MHLQLFKLFVAGMVIWIVPALLADDAAKDKPKAPAAAAVKPSEGTLIIGGKSYKLTHVVAYQSKVFEADLVSVILCSKPIAVDKLKKALLEGKGSDDSFSLFDPNVKVTYSDSGEPAYSNSYADNSSLSASGGGMKGKLTVKDGRAIGNATMSTDNADPQRKKSFNIAFDAPLLIVKITAPEPKPATDDNAKSKPQQKGKESSKKGKPADDGTPINVHDLPIPKDATHIEMKKLVEMIDFQSPSDVKTMTEFLIKQLKAQGWEGDDDADLVTAKSAILDRKKGKASLTIFVKPEAKGSKVHIMSEGLAWDDKQPAKESDK